MTIGNLTISNFISPSPHKTAPAQLTNSDAKANQPQETQEAFQQFVGETFYQMMLKSLRSSQSEAAYFHGGQAEKMFQGQLDQHLVEQMASQNGNSMSQDLYQLFELQRRSPVKSSTALPGTQGES